MKTKLMAYLPGIDNLDIEIESWDLNENTRLGYPHSLIIHVLHLILFRGILSVLLRQFIPAFANARFCEDPHNQVVDAHPIVKA